jgi:spermidine/putrescine transport system substrate-binding protein
MESLDKALIEQYPNIGMTPADLMKEEQLRDLGDGQKLYTQTVTEITFQ